MCYDIRYLTKKQIDYARRFGEDGRDLSELLKRLSDFDRATGQPVFHVSGFNHPDIPVITNIAPDKIQFYSWGLIPSWINNTQRAVQISNKTLNARGEEIFSKPAFKESIKSKRCIVIVDGFFEHHYKNNKIYPYHITTKNGEPLALAGIWANWNNREFVRQTVSIVTTKANTLLKGIHNNPKIEEPRMPVILNRISEKEWLYRNELKKNQYHDFLIPNNSIELVAFPVGRLRGKEYKGNVKETIEPCFYPELSEKTLFDS